MSRIAAPLLPGLIAGVVAGALPVGSAAAASAEHKPQHVMSLNICADQLILQLLPPARISSVTYLSRIDETSFLTDKAQSVAINHGTSEEVLRDAPDLVIAGNNSTPAVRALLKRVGIPLIEVPAAENFAAIRSNTRLVAHAVGEDATGESLLAHMDATLADLAATAPKRRIVVAGWEDQGNVPGPGTLFDAILTAAGGENVIAGLKTGFVYGRYTGFDLEQLVAMRPDILAYASSRLGRRDLASEQLHHRVVRKLYAARTITYPETLYSCGLPQSAEAARDLRRTMLAAMGKENSAP
jgi:iron complex transport system substrate-binding protein